MPESESRFPGQFALLDAQVLRRAYALGPTRLRAAMSGLEPEQWKMRARGAQTWSAMEIAFHLADAETVGALRFRLALASPGARLPGYDQMAFAEQLRYRDRRPTALADVLYLFECLRRTTLELLDSTVERWDEAYGVHPWFGKVTVRNLLEFYADHGERHVEQIVAIRRAMGAPKDLPPLLPERLY